MQTLVGRSDTSGGDAVSTLPEIVNWLEGDDSLQLGRILVLIDAFAGRSGTQSIEGLTKLAKLDFLLRYPAYLERALKARQASDSAAEVQDFERSSVEARMVRFRFGPWDHRYRRLLNVLVAKGLIIVRNDGRTVVIHPTERGRTAATKLAESPEYASIRHRASLLKRHLDLTATNLMEFVYATFPEVVSLRLGEIINK
jgi:hypothetical protein